MYRHFCGVLARSVVPLLAIVGGAAQSPRLVFDARSGAMGSMAGTSFSIVPSHRAGEVFFQLDDGIHGVELWRSDGSAAGTSLVADLTMPGSTVFGYLGAQVDGLWFVVLRSAGPELWRTDGTAAGTVRVLDGSALGVAFLTTPLLRFADGSFVLEADGVLMRSDGTLAGTRSLGVPAGAIFEAGGGGLWVLDTAQRQLWSSDGTSTNGTIVANGVGSVAAGLGGLVIGQNGGTILRVLGVTPSPQTTLPESVLFWARDDVVFAFGSTRVWTWDGRNAPVLLGTFASVPVASGGFFAFAQVGRSLLFFPDDGVHGFEPWWTDGTPAGTRLLADMTPGAASTAVMPGFTVEDRIVFWAQTPGIGSEPWSTDGTPAGTVLLGDLEPGAGSSFTDANSGAGGIGYRRVVKPITTSAVGTELWVSDGTAAGTRLLGDVNPGPASAVQPLSFWGWHAGTSLIVALDDGTHGIEPHAVDLVAASAPLLGGCSQKARYAARDPILGTPWRLAAHEITFAGAALVALPASAPFPFGPRCGLQVDPATTAVLASITPNAVGEWSGTRALPASSSLVGAQVVTQAVFLAPSLPLGFEIADAWFATLGF